MMALVETGEVGANFESVTGEGTESQQKNSDAALSLFKAGTRIATSGNSEIATKPNLPSESSALSRKWTKRC